MYVRTLAANNSMTVHLIFWNTGCMHDQQSVEQTRTPPIHSISSRVITPHVHSNQINSTSSQGEIYPSIHPHPHPLASSILILFPILIFLHQCTHAVSFSRSQKVIRSGRSPSSPHSPVLVRYTTACATEGTPHPSDLEIKPGLTCGHEGVRLLVLLIQVHGIHGWRADRASRFIIRLHTNRAYSRITRSDFALRVSDGRQ